jgi:hypothetical protein
MLFGDQARLFALLLALQLGLVENGGYCRNLGLVQAEQLSQPVNGITRVTGALAHALAAATLAAPVAHPLGECRAGGQCKQHYNQYDLFHDYLLAC